MNWQESFKRDLSEANLEAFSEEEATGQLAVIDSAMSELFRMLRGQGQGVAALDRALKSADRELSKARKELDKLFS